MIVKRRIWYTGDDVIGPIAITWCRPYEPRLDFDPLDVTYDGVLLRRLIKMDEDRQRENIVGAIISPAQRAAISAYWSAQLRAKVESKRKDDEAASVSVYVEQEIEW